MDDQGFNGLNKGNQAINPLPLVVALKPIPCQLADLSKLPIGLASLVAKNRWVNWNYAFKRSKWDKPPVGDYTDASKWLTHAEAVRRLNRNTGIGFVLTEDDDIAAIDFDDIRRGETDVAKWVKPFLDKAEALKAYTEPTVSGRGARIIGRVRRTGYCGQEVKNLDGPKSGFEIYCHRSKYITISGHGGEGDDEGEGSADVFIDEIIDDLLRAYPAKTKTEQFLEIVQKHAPHSLGKPQMPSGNVVQGPFGRHNVGAALQSDLTDPPPETQEEINKLWSVLNHVGPDGKRIFDPDCGYKEWINTLLSIAATGWTCALEIADAWSKPSGKYVDGEVAKKFASFKPGRSPRNERSLYRAAIDAGWIEPLAQRPVVSSPQFVPTATGQFVGSAPGAQPQQAPVQMPLKVFMASELLKDPAPAQEWIVPPWIPRGEVTMLAGDGGGGKSILMLQLGVACDTGGEWLGIKVAPCNALYLSGEDPKDELHRRLERIARQQQVQPESLKRFKLVDLATEEATEFVTPVRVGKDTKLQTTALFATVERLATESSSGLIIIDASADFYGGEESTRREVRAFIRLLRGLAMRLNAAIVLIAHPSVEGMKTGRNYSGSTHWNNGVRSRLAFTKPEKTDENPEPDPDIRVLELAKSNRTKAGEKIELRWVEGEFKRDREAVGGTREAVKEANDRMAEAKEAFLALLDAFTEQGRKVNCAGGKTYAPKMMAEHVPHLIGSNGRRFTQKELTTAMNLLFSERAIKNETDGPPSKQRSYLVRQ